MKKLEPMKILEIFLSGISLILSIILIVMLYNLNILPEKYSLSIIIILLVLNALGNFFMVNEKTSLKVIGYIILGLVIIANMIGNYYIKTTDKFLNKSFKKVTKEEIKDIYNIYIGGVDFTDEIYDFNTILSFNEEKEKLLLVSIPRGFHIEAVGYNMTDNLSYIGINGIDVAIKSLEKFLDTKIDYYVKINTKSLVALVDSLGGLEYCSDEEYLTTHAMVLDTYDDTKGKKLYVKKGCRTYSGIEILTIARERLHIKGSDIKRQENCQKILISLIDKILSFNTLANYEEILDKVDALYETNIPREQVKKLIKKRLDNKLNFNIETVNLTGNDKMGYVRLGTVYDYINVPNMDTVEVAKKKLNENLTKK